MDISQAKDDQEVASGAGFNTGASKTRIRAIRADADGNIEVITPSGNTTSFNVQQSEVIELQGKFEITTNTNIKIQVYL